MYPVQFLLDFVPSIDLSVQIDHINLLNTSMVFINDAEEGFAYRFGADTAHTKLQSINQSGEHSRIHCSIHLDVSLVAFDGFQSLQFLSSFR